jgi:hypothetical protein
VPFAVWLHPLYFSRIATYTVQNRNTSFRTGGTIEGQEAADNHIFRKRRSWEGRRPAVGIFVDIGQPFYMFWYSRDIDGKSRDRDAASIIREADSVAL